MQFSVVTLNDYSKFQEKVTLPTYSTPTQLQNTTMSSPRKALYLSNRARRWSRVKASVLPSPTMNRGRLVRPQSVNRRNSFSAKS